MPRIEGPLPPGSNGSTGTELTGEHPATESKFVRLMDSVGQDHDAWEGKLRERVAKIVKADEAGPFTKLINSEQIDERALQAISLDIGAVETTADAKEVQVELARYFKDFKPGKEISDFLRGSLAAKMQKLTPVPGPIRQPSEQPHLDHPPPLISGPSDHLEKRLGEEDEPPPMVVSTAPAERHDVALNRPTHPADEWSALFTCQKSFGRRPDLAEKLREAFRAADATERAAAVPTVPDFVPAKSNAEWATRAAFALDARLLLARAAYETGMNPDVIFDTTAEDIDEFLASRPAIRDAVEPLVRIERCLQSLEEEEAPVDEKAMMQLLRTLAGFDLHEISPDNEQLLGATLFPDFQPLFRSNEVIAQMNFFIEEVSDQRSKEAHEAVLKAYIHATTQAPPPTRRVAETG